MIKYILLLLALLYCSNSISAEYATDSIKIEQLLKESKTDSCKAFNPLYWAKLFIDCPYKAGTLESTDGSERLIIELNKFDCTTFIETVSALTLTAHAGQIKFDDYKTNLRRLRYRKGILEDYTTRLHYFSDWIIDNSRKGLVKEIGNLYPKWFDGIQTLSISFMSSNPHLYIALQKHPEWIPVIQKQEKDLTGLKIHYLSTEKLCQNPTYLKSLIHDGDILATVTSKTGLDVAHLGFAKWEKGQLYWINASSIYHRVVLDSLPLCKYLKKQPRIKGIRVIRLNLNTICTSVLDNNTLIAG